MRKHDVNSVENVHFNLRLCKHNLMQKTTLLQQSPTYITICCQCCLRSITHLAGKTLVLKVRYRKYLAGKDEINRSHGLGIYIPQMTKKHIWPAPKIIRQRVLLRYFRIEITAGRKVTTSIKKSIDPPPYRSLEEVKVEVGIKIDAKIQWNLKKKKGEVRCVPSPPPPQPSPPSLTLGILFAYSY